MLEIPKMQEEDSFFLTMKRCWQICCTAHRHRENINLSKLPHGDERGFISW